MNRPDVAQRQGAYPPPPGASPVIGLEVAGEVVAAGAEVTAYKPGDKVCALTNGGGYAEYCVAPAAQCLPWPAGYDAIRAAALPETYFTVWANLFDRGRLAPGETRAGPWRQLGHRRHRDPARRANSAPPPTPPPDRTTRCAACVRLGAAAAINYRSQDFVEEIKRLTGGRGVDVVLDMVGAAYFPRNIRCLALDGRLVLIAFLEGSKVEKFDLVPVMTRRLTVTGSTMRPRTTAQKGAIAAALRAKVWPVLDGRAVRAGDPYGVPAR